MTVAGDLTVATGSYLDNHLSMRARPWNMALN